MATTTKEVTLDAGVLARAHQRVKKVSNRRSAVAVLNSALLHGVNGELVIEATDMETAVRVFCGVPAPSDLRLLVDHKALDGALKTIGKKGEVTLAQQESGDGQLTTERGRRLTLPQGMVAEWPHCHFEDDGALVVHAVGSQLAVAVETVANFASDDETRPVLCGVHVNPESGELVATDSYALGCTPLPGTVKDLAAFTVPAKGLALATRGLRDDEGVMLKVGGFRDVEEQREPSWAQVHISGAIYTVRLIEGQYPAYRQLRPDAREFTVHLTMDQAEALDVFKAAAEALSHKHMFVVAMTVLKASLKVEGRDDSGAEFADKIKAEVERDGAFEGRAGVNASTMARALSVMDSEEQVVLSFIAPTRPMLIESGHDWSIIMPVRLNN